jgi:hypothetical protein
VSASSAVYLASCMRTLCRLYKQQLQLLALFQTYSVFLQELKTPRHTAVCVHCSALLQEIKKQDTAPLKIATVRVQTSVADFCCRLPHNSCWPHVCLSDTLTAHVLTSHIPYCLLLLAAAHHLTLATPAAVMIPRGVPVKTMERAAAATQQQPYQAGPTATQQQPYQAGPAATQGGECPVAAPALQRLQHSMQAVTDMNVSLIICSSLLGWCLVLRRPRTAVSAPGWPHSSYAVWRMLC